MSPYAFGTTVPSSDATDTTHESDVFGFVLLYCRAEPHRVGEVGLLAPFARTRGGRGKEGLQDFLRFGQHRPGAAPVLAPIEWALKDSAIGREQFTATAQAMHIDLVVVNGTCPTYVNDLRIAVGESAQLVVGDLVALGDAALLLVVKRQRIMPALTHLTEIHPFGKPNSFGAVFESPVMWTVEDALSLAAARHNHVLILGESGTGKEAAAKTIHYRSPRANKMFNALNIATVGSGIFAAEVFGSMANYPSAGMPARDGLLPVAADGTVFLDEVGGLSQDDQTKMCRAMEDGTYNKVGEARARQLLALIVAATSADPNVLKVDFRKRFPREIRIPPLRERKEDIVLVLTCLVLREAEKYPKEMARFLEEWPDGSIVPRLKIEFVAALVQHPLPGNVRDVYQFLLQALAESRGNWIELPRDLAAATKEARSSNAPSSNVSPSKSPSSKTPSVPTQSGRRPKATKEEVIAALEKAGSTHGAALLLGVPRTTLRAWMVEYGLKAPEDTARGARS